MKPILEVWVRRLSTAAVAVVLFAACGSDDPRPTVDGTPDGANAEIVVVDTGWNISTAGFTLPAGDEVAFGFVNERDTAATVQLFLSDVEHDVGDPPIDEPAVTRVLAPGEEVIEQVTFAEPGSYVAFVDPATTSDLFGAGGSFEVE